MKATKPKAPKKLGRVGTLAQAAGELKKAGCSASVEILKAAKAAGCPGFDDHSRINCDAVRAWLEDPENIEGVQASPALRKARANARLEELKVERMDWRNQTEKEKHVPRSELNEQLMKLFSDQKSILQQKVELEIPALFPEGELREKARAECCALVDQICDMMRALREKWKPVNAQ